MDVRAQRREHDPCRQWAGHRELMRARLACRSRWIGAGVRHRKRGGSAFALGRAGPRAGGMVACDRGTLSPPSESPADACRAAGADRDAADGPENPSLNFRGPRNPGVPETAGLSHVVFFRRLDRGPPRLRSAWSLPRGIRGALRSRRRKNTTRADGGRSPLGSGLRPRVLLRPELAAGLASNDRLLASGSLASDGSEEAARSQNQSPTAISAAS